MRNGDPMWEWDGLAGRRVSAGFRLWITDEHSKGCLDGTCLDVMGSYT